MYIYNGSFRLQIYAHTVHYNSCYIQTDPGVCVPMHSHLLIKKKRLESENQLFVTPLMSSIHSFLDSVLFSTNFQASVMIIQLVANFVCMPFDAEQLVYSCYSFFLFFVFYYSFILPRPDMWIMSPVCGPQNQSSEHTADTEKAKLYLHFLEFSFCERPLSHQAWSFDSLIYCFIKLLLLLCQINRFKRILGN